MSLSIHDLSTEDGTFLLLRIVDADSTVLPQVAAPRLPLPLLAFLFLASSSLTLFSHF